VARLLGPQEIEDISVGAAILGSGGGGDPHIGKLMALQAIEEFGPVRLVTPDELPPDQLAVPAAMMGAPTVMVEKIPNGQEIGHAFEILSEFLGQEVAGIVPIEAGGLNSMIPLALSAALQIPTIDLDGMGRAFPELQMVTFHLGGISATPMVITDEKGNSSLLRTVDNVWTERLARALTVQMGGAAMIAIYPMTVRQAKEHGILGAMSLAEKLGRILREARHSERSPLDALLEDGGGFKLFTGKITDVVRRTDGGFVRGEVSLDGIDECRGHELSVSFQNENLAAILDGEVLASVPDLIVALDTETGHPVTTEALRYGLRVVVVAFPCAEQWRTQSGLEVCGPRYFGYDIEYKPIETVELPW
jgi:uncharacterized protein